MAWVGVGWGLGGGGAREAGVERSAIAVLGKTIYRYICHPSKENLQTRFLLNGFKPVEFSADYLQNGTVVQSYRKRSDKDF